jgi:hypothetical protein
MHEYDNCTWYAYYFFDRITFDEKQKKGRTSIPHEVDMNREKDYHK